MNAHQSHAVGPFAITISGSDQWAVDAIDRLFQGFGPASQGSPLELRVERRAAQLVAIADDDTIATAATIEDLGLAVTRVVNRRVLDAEPDLVHFHAGATTRDGQTVLVVGPSMAGKSTIVAKLVSAGWQYLSDEQIGVTPQGALVAYPRSITLRRSSWHLFESVADRANSIDASVARIEVPPTVLGQVYGGDPIRPTIVITPNVAADAPKIETLTAADTMALLVADSLDLERAGTSGLDAMVAIASSAAAFRVSGRGSAQVCKHIVQVSQSARATGSPTQRQIVPSDERSVRIPGTYGWLFADQSAAIYEPATGLMASLDESGYLAWSSFRSVATASEVPTELAGFVAELQVAGLLLNTREAR